LNGKVNDAVTLYITIGNYELLVGVRDGGNQEVIQNFRTNSNIK
jgi:hypothetical protein